MRGEAALNARQAVPSADLDLELRDLNLAPFFQDTPFANEMQGRVGGQFYLLGTGWTLAELLGSVGGNGRLHIQGASLSALVVEAIGLDVIEALGLVIADRDAKVPLRCGVVDFTASDGVIKIDRGLIDTADSVLIAGGQVSLKAETLAVKIRAEGKDLSLLDVDAPVVVTGPLRKPKVNIGEIEGLPIELGAQEDLNCRQRECR